MIFILEMVITQVFLGGAVQAYHFSPAETRIGKLIDAGIWPYDLARYFIAQRMPDRS